MEPHLVAAQAARICLDAGVSITGAFDDAMAVIAGGIHMTDNASCHVLHRHIQVPPWVAVWIPDAPISKQQVRPIDVGAARPGARKAQQALLRGELGLAMRHNHAAYFPVYKDAGLPVADEPVLAALDAGAIGATISGTGPAVGALFDARTRLDDVEGGTWRWCRTREAH